MYASFFQLPSVKVWIMSQPIWTSFSQPTWTSFSQPTWTSLSQSVEALPLPHCSDCIQKNAHQFYLSKLGMNEYLAIPTSLLHQYNHCYTLNLKFLYESTVIHSLSFSPHSHHCPPLLHTTALLSPHSYHCPLLCHITVLPSTSSHHCPPLPYKNQYT